MSTFVLPGDPVPIPPTPGKPLKLGPGLLHVPNDDGSDVVIATKAGVLGTNKKRKELWVESNATRYVPAPQESVVGIITNRSGEGYRVDIAGAHTAYLDSLSFEGASKRNKPNLKVGAIVYARVSLAHKDMEPELECFDANTRKADGFGELKGGFITQCSLRLCRRLFDPSYFLIPTLGAKFQMEIVLGLNGRIWIKSADPKTTVAIARCIDAVDTLSYGKEEVESLFNTMDLA
ncbi:exosome non-catalytic core subunit rrp40 [Tulasnella sp. 424]|nr:exosome non-catalytic core subunit rrp40 [Tulasnella sp. 424]KAG8977144.1 exosome non-catalytic core subunit rrp40 [Tulasnella sp. 425]